MANRRMISKSISISTKVNSISDFAALLFTWMIPHTDDYGVLEGSPGTVKALVIPRRKQTEKQVAEALGELQRVGLIWWYYHNEHQYVQFVNFDEHQDGLHKRTKSKYPTFMDSGLNINEAEIEEIIYEMVNSGEMLINGEKLTVEKQLRIGNSYIDLTCYNNEKMTCIMELKRHKLSNSALEQIIGYKKTLNKMGKNPATTLVGFGLSANFDIELAKEEKVNIYIYDENLQFERILLSDVNPCQITNNLLTANRTEPNRREPNRREEKEKVSSKQKYAEQVYMTGDEYEKLVDRFGPQDAQERVERLSLYKLSKGVSYKSDYATILSWAKKDVGEVNKKKVTAFEICQSIARGEDIN